MRQKLPLLGQDLDKLLVKLAGNGHAVERPVRGNDIIQLPGLALLDKLIAVLGLWSHDFGNV